MFSLDAIDGPCSLRFRTRASSPLYLHFLCLSVDSCDLNCPEHYLCKHGYLRQLIVWHPMFLRVLLNFNAVSSINPLTTLILAAAL